MGGFLGALTAWWLGKPVLLVEKFSAPLVIELAQRYRLGVLGMTPAMVWELAQVDIAAQLPCVDSVIVGTAAIPEATRIAFEEKYHVPVLRNYGQTEFAGAIAFERPGDVAAGKRPDRHGRAGGPRGRGRDPRPGWGAGTDRGGGRNLGARSCPRCRDT